jgi:hypothetical protein
MARPLLIARFRLKLIAKGFSVFPESTFATEADLPQRWKIVVDVHHISQFLAAFVS